MNYKRFIFPAFEYDALEDPISFKGGQISWKLFHDLFEKDGLLEANLRKAPKISHKVLHPGNCKQNISVAPTIFHESTSVAVTSYFSEKKMRQKFWNFLIHGGLFPVLKFSFQTSFWAYFASALIKWGGSFWKVCQKCNPPPPPGKFWKIWRKCHIAT